MRKDLEPKRVNFFSVVLLLALLSHASPVRGQTPESNPCSQLPKAPVTKIITYLGNQEAVFVSDPSLEPGKCFDTSVGRITIYTENGIPGMSASLWPATLGDKTGTCEMPGINPEDPFCTFPTGK